MENELLELKEKAKITNATIAEESGVPESTVTRIINGRTASPSADVYEAIKSTLIRHVAETRPSSDNGKHHGENVLDMFERILKEKDNRIERLEKLDTYHRMWIRILAALLIVVFIASMAVIIHYSVN